MSLVSLLQVSLLQINFCKENQFSAVVLHPDLEVSRRAC